MAEFLPRQDVAFVDPSGRATNPFYVWLQSLERAAREGGPSTAELQAQISEIALKLGSPDGTVENIPDGAWLSAETQVAGILSVVSIGSLQAGSLALQLVNDEDAPAGTHYYGTSADSDAEKGYHAVSDTMEAEAGELTKAVDGDGVTTFGLADVTPDAGGTLQLTQFDAKGRRSHEGAADTDDLPEGATNLYFTAQRVRDTVLTGLSLATNAAITAADSVLVAFGKLQAQITALAASLSGYVTTTTNQTVAGVKTFTNNPRIANSAPQVYFDETDIPKSWVMFAQASTLFISEDSTAGGNSRVRIRAGSSELDLAVGSLLYGGSVVRTAANSPAGTYTPTATGTTNVSSATGELCTYARNGDTVTLSGRVNVTPTTGGAATRVDISLPVGSNFSSGTQASGAAVWQQNIDFGAGYINSSAGPNMLSISFLALNTSSHTIRFSITYPILP